MTLPERLYRGGSRNFHLPSDSTALYTPCKSGALEDEATAFETETDDNAKGSGGFRGNSRTPGNDTGVGPFQGLDGPKRLWVAAVFWLLGGWAGLHRLYLGDHAGAKKMLFTCGNLLMDWVADGWRLSTLVRTANGEQEPEAEECQVRVVRPLDAACHAAYPKNHVSNTKYGTTKVRMWLQFFPLSLYEQMHYFTNRYFTFIAVLQLDSYLTPTHPATTWIPLLIIFLFTAIRELVDDRQRLAADTVANLRQYHVASAAAKPRPPRPAPPLAACPTKATAAHKPLLPLPSPPHNALAHASTGTGTEAVAEGGVDRGEGGVDDGGGEEGGGFGEGWQRVAAEDIQVGDLVVVCKEEEVPCDLVLLTSSQSEGNCLLETSNLDGEADLKLRRSLTHTALTPLPLLRAQAAATIASLRLPLLAPHTLTGCVCWRSDRESSRERHRSSASNTVRPPPAPIAKAPDAAVSALSEVQALLQVRMCIHIHCAPAAVRRTTRIGGGVCGGSRKRGV